MNKYVKLINNCPVADSRVIAFGFGTTNKSILNLSRSHESGLKKFGKVTFQRAPTESGQTQTFIELNERQVMLLLTYTRSNKATDSFRESLVREFFEMRQQLEKNEVIRLSGVQARKSLTESVQDSGENERMHGHGYSTYTKMIYEITGLRDEYQSFHKENPKGNFRISITPDELDRVRLAESLIKPLIELEKQYSEIKDTLKPLFETREIS